jgi:uncharacterized membrane protein YukC
MDTNTPFYPVPTGSASTGISYYDWIAAVALQALATKGVDVKADRAMSDEDRDLELATRAYKLADAMLRVRTKAAADRAAADRAALDRAVADRAKQNAEPRPARSPARV